MELIQAITMCVDESRVSCGGLRKEGCELCEATDMLIKAFGIDESQLTPITATPTPETSLTGYRRRLEPRLVHLIAVLRHHQVEEAVSLLLDYIDASSEIAKATLGPSAK